MNELISIVVPVYNAEKTLERCVRSLLRQTYENLEVILVNDGSKDGSLALCRGYEQQDNRVRVIDKPNGGVSSARNAGLDAARGEFVMFCDSDDWVEPDWCRCMREHHVGGGLTVCRIAREDVAEEDTAELTVETADRKEFLHYPMLMLSPVNKLYMRSVIEERQVRFPEKLHLGEDFSFVLDYLCGITGQVYFLSKALYCYDVSIEDSLSKRKPTPEQCDLFCRLVTDSMERLGATDDRSVYSRDKFVMIQFESMLDGTARNEKLSVAEKMAIAGRTSKMHSFRRCSGEVVIWGNPLYRWMFRRRAARMIMLYLLLREWKHRR